MTRRHKRNRENQKNRSQQTQARLSMESLEPRQLMTASPVYGPLPDADLSPTFQPNFQPTVSSLQAESVVGCVANPDLSSTPAPGISRTTVTQQGAKINIQGTPFNDYVEISQPDSETIIVTVFKDVNRNTVSTSRTFKRSDKTYVWFEGKAGNDYLWNGSTQSMVVELGKLGQRTIVVPFQRHDLRVIGQGGTGDDHLEGGPKNDLLSGGPNDDRLVGNNGRDMYYGGEGDDTLIGGKDHDFMIGGGGNDNLYGHGDDDHLDGGKGLDGLFGGAGKDYLIGGADPDRYLWQTGDRGIVTSEDARIRFKNHSGGASHGTRWTAGRWTDREIEAIDGVFRVLHLETGNTKLLKGFSLIRRGSPESSVDVAAWNTDWATHNEIHLSNVVFNNTDSMYESLFHEIGHNWDTEHGAERRWRSLSGWITRGRGNSSTHQQSVLANNSWRHLRSAEFVSDHAKNDPQEDFAETFSAIFMKKAGRTFGSDKIPTGMAANPLIDPGGDNNIVDINALDTKREYITDWLDRISS